jgi:NADH:ubiquinone oxidoreductase subunit 6 (subunit J)
MTTRPELRDTGNLLPAVAAVALFVVMAVVFLGAPIGDAAGFPQNAEVANESIGDASVASNASIVENNGTFAQVNTSSGTQQTQLSDETGVNATIVTAGGSAYGIVTEPVSVTETIGYAMFGLTEQLPAELKSESFLAVFEIIDLVLVAALVGAVTLARREDLSTVVSLFTSSEDAAPSGAVAADGGSEPDAVEESTDGGDA